MGNKISTRTAVASLVGLLLTEPAEHKRKTILCRLEAILDKRRKRLANRYGISEFHGAYGALSDYSNRLSELFCHDEFLALLRNTSRIAIEKRGDECIYSINHNQLIRVAAVNKTLIFVNPYTEKSQIWGRLKYEQPLYHAGKASKHKSTFLPGQNAEKLIKTAFLNPVGILFGSNYLILNYRFPHYVGEQKNQPNSRTDIIRVYCERIKRDKGTGYQVRVHGHPISEAELDRDLKSYPALKALLA